MNLHKKCFRNYSYVPQLLCVYSICLVCPWPVSRAAAPSLSSVAGQPFAESASGSWSIVEPSLVSSLPWLLWPSAAADDASPLEPARREGGREALIGE